MDMNVTGSAWKAGFVEKAQFSWLRFSNFSKFLLAASSTPIMPEGAAAPTPAPSPIAIIVVTHRKELRNEQIRPPFLTGIVGPATVARPRPSAAHAV